MACKRLRRDYKYLLIKCHFYKRLYTALGYVSSCFITWETVNFDKVLSFFIQLYIFEEGLIPIIPLK
jgi:hypothetical protein